MLDDRSFERKGSESHLRSRYKECGWVYAFYSSKKINKSVEVDKRFTTMSRTSFEAGRVELFRSEVPYVPICQGISSNDKHAISDLKHAYM